jgi:hypothetical protein
MIKIGLLMIVGGAGMFTMFATFRCITFLTVPTLVTYPGRVFLNALMVQNILEGRYFAQLSYRLQSYPIQNFIFVIRRRLFSYEIKISTAAYMYDRVLNLMSAKCLVLQFD